MFLSINAEGKLEQRVRVIKARGSKGSRERRGGMLSWTCKIWYTDIVSNEEDEEQ